MVHVYGLLSAPDESVHEKAKFLNWPKRPPFPKQSRLKPYSNFVRYNLKKWMEQDIGDNTLDVVLCDNRCGQGFRDYFGDLIKRNKSGKKQLHTIKTEGYVNTASMFNLAVQYFRDKKTYEFFVHNASDCFLHRSNDLMGILQCFDRKTGIVSPIVDVDNRPGWTGEDRFKFDGTTEYTVHVGESIQQHFCVFHDRFLKHYEYKITEVCASGGIESLCPFMTASVGLRSKYCGKFILEHLQMGFYGQGKNVFMNPSDSLERILHDGKKIGFGWPSMSVLPIKGKVHMQHLYPIDFSFFRKNTIYTKGDQLRQFLLDRFFLKPDVFNYKQYPFEVL